MNSQKNNRREWAGMSWRGLGFEQPREVKDANPIIPRNGGYRTPDGQILGDPPIGRSALDMAGARR